MKKFVASLAVGAFVVSLLAACGGVEGDPNSEPVGEPGIEEPADDGIME